MKVFRIKVDVDRFQYFSPVHESVWATGLLAFDGTPKLASWTAPEVYVYKPKRPRANFSHLSVGSFCVDERTREAVPDFLDNSGELLPFNHNGELFHLLNVTECVDALNPAHTTWREFGGVRTSIDKYAFYGDRVPRRCVFKIPETCRGEMLSVEGRDDPLDEFIPIIKRLGLTGLIFEEIWNDGK